MSEVKKLWRCHNHDAPVEFWGTDGKCPECPATFAKNPECVVKLEIIHFDPPSGIKNKGMNIRACDGKPWNYPEGEGRSTGDVSVVNCPLCKQSESFKMIEEAGANAEINQQSLNELLERDRQAAELIERPEVLQG